MSDLLDDLQARFFYKDGGLYVKESFQWKGKVGERAGSTRPSDGRRIIQVRKRRYFEHILVWVWFNGKLPDCSIDHIDRDPTNNRIENLRLATPTQQGINRGRQKNNTTGYKGVNFRPNVKAKPYRVTVGSTHVGYYATELEAAQAYDAKVIELYGEFANTNFGTK